MEISGFDDGLYEFRSDVLLRDAAGRETDLSAILIIAIVDGRVDVAVDDVRVM